MLKLLVPCFFLVRYSDSLLIPWYSNFNFLYLEVILNQQLVHGNLTQRMAVFLLNVKQNSSVSLNDLKPVFYLEDNLSTDSCILFNCLFISALFYSFSSSLQSPTLEIILLKRSHFLILYISWSMNKSWNYIHFPHLCTKIKNLRLTQNKKWE